MAHETKAFGKDHNAFGKIFLFVNPCDPTQELTEYHNGIQFCMHYALYVVKLCHISWFCSCCVAVQRTMGRRTTQTSLGNDKLLSVFYKNKFIYLTDTKTSENQWNFHSQSRKIFVVALRRCGCEKHSEGIEQSLLFATNKKKIVTATTCAILGLKLWMENFRRHRALRCVFLAMIRQFSCALLNFPYFMTIAAEPKSFWCCWKF